MYLFINIFSCIIQNLIMIHNFNSLIESTNKKKNNKFKCATIKKESTTNILTIQKNLFNIKRIWTQYIYVYKSG